MRERSLRTTFTFAASTAFAADAWPGFRGAGDSVAKGDYPLKWSPTEGVAWKVDLPGYGQSCPVAWNGVGVPSPPLKANSARRVTSLLSMPRPVKRSGGTPSSRRRKRSGRFTISRVAPTPCVDADGVYCFFEGGNLISLSRTRAKSDGSETS